MTKCGAVVVFLTVEAEGGEFVPGVVLKLWAFCFDGVVEDGQVCFGDLDDPVFSLFEFT